MSSDTAESWTSINNGLGSLSIYSLTVFNNTLFAATSNGVYKTLDHGLNWSVAGTGLPGGQVFTVKQFGTRLFAACSWSGVYMSLDSAKTWAVLNPSMNDNANEIAMTDSLIFVGTNNALFVSSDSGETWSNSNMFNYASGVSDIISLGQYLFAATSSGVFRSSDNGITWNHIPGSGFDLEAIDSALFIASYSQGIEVSFDYGNSWTQCASGLSGSSIRGITSIGKNIFAGNYAYYGGVDRSSDYGQSWQHVNKGINGSFIHDLLAIGNDIWATGVGPASGVCKTSDEGQSWSYYNTGIPSTILTSIVNIDSNLFVGVDGYGIYYSSDYGANWVFRSQGVATSIEDLCVIDSTLITGTYGAVYITNDNGISWSHSSGFNPPNTAVYNITRIGSALFAGTNSGAYRSTDN